MELTFGEKLRILREKHHYKQEELARLLKISQQTLSGYEKGRSEPNFEILKALASLFNVSLDYLLGHSEKTVDPPETPDNKTIKSKPDLREGLSEEEQKQLETFRAFLISQREVKDGQDEQAAMGK